MLRDRGYLISDKSLNMSRDEFKVFFEKRKTDQRTRKENKVENPGVEVLNMHYSKHVLEPKKANPEEKDDKNDHQPKSGQILTYWMCVPGEKIKRDEITQIATLML